MPRYQDLVRLITVRDVPTGGGYSKEVLSYREVFANIKSVGRSEFYAARQSDVELAMTVEMRTWDYEGERRLEHGGKLYTVERQYTKDGEMLQLNCSEFRGGVK